MWCDGRDMNDSGERILLLQPSSGGKQTRKKTMNSPSSSHIGGFPYFYEDDPLRSRHSLNTVCTTCGQPMHLLLQLNAPVDDLDRTLYVLGCNRPSCHMSRGTEANDCKFRLDFGQSPIRCFRSQRPRPSGARDSVKAAAPIADAAPQSKNLEINDWGENDDWSTSGSGDGDDDWGIGEHAANKATDVSMDDLEAMISKCEMQSTIASNHRTSNSQNNVQSTTARDNAANKHDHESAPSFRHCNLEMFDEPSAPRKGDSEKIMDGDEEDDDEDFGYDNIDSSKINQMLSKYLATEEDEEILSALKGKPVASNEGLSRTVGKGSAGGERYERISPEERAFLAFSNRLKRAPRQVVRYAYGGLPLWSVPHLHQNHGPNKEKKSSKMQRKSSPKRESTSSKELIPAVPPCICGCQRVFEFQLLPTLLHVLDVDSCSPAASETDDLMDLTSMGGMNWGSIAVYSCPDSCDESREEVCVVQAGDEAPVNKMDGSTGDCAEDNDVDDCDDYSIDERED
ncbi:hypothetical protein HJC23_004843 [Cyclotella cryptica]|uniref:Programmed cell death protein 2 C-terminal domain-containing protein n=1 Tax=Cyclotella cryptica TaxID=29204 RepID=A0ABD3P1Y2_9STRA|eukprot:CCRYP_018286-RB/>CCRYP_018286-RB protein AED:0.02 eAED:0.02 QI:4177/1/1/1/1/0.33/3/299/511